ncbi:MAG: Phosphodiesterase [Candidatus Methanolliviera sp. GoM_asphalt]|nr:MAG: Phosphodiesterase [Candidatus Methanolliviera sp. GoM_asphalt]
MKIGVISDTHADSIGSINEKIIEELKRVDLVVHAGDITSLRLLNELREINEVVAVRGNMDMLEVKKILPEREEFKVGEIKIGVIHGWGSPFGLEKKIIKRFDDVDVIIYGHTHRAKNEWIGDLLLFNPGMTRKSYGILKIDETVEGEIIKI